MISSCSPSARAIASGDSSHIRVLLCTSVKTKVTTPPGRSVIAADDMVARRRTYVLLVDPDRSPATRVSLHKVRPASQSYRAAASSCDVQDGQRVAVNAISVVQNGHGRVVASSCFILRAARLFSGATT